MNPASRRFWYLLGLPLLFLASCAEGVAVEVNVTGLTSEVASLSVSTTLDGHSSDQGKQVIRQDLSSFVLKLPAGSSGHLMLGIDGTTDNQELGPGCLVAHGERQLDIGDQTHYQVEVPLNEVPDKGCGVVVEMTGIAFGSVTSDPRGATCTKMTTDRVRCVGHFHPGTQVTLTAVPDKFSYFSNWAGACEGHDPRCVVGLENGTKHVQANLIPPPVCSAGRWCWDNPLPTGSVLHAIWGSSAQDIWAVGEGGVILHWNGSFWVAVPSRTPRNLYAVWGSGPQDVWAVGATGTVLRWNGTSWSLVPSGADQNLFGVWGSGPQDVWAVGVGGTVLR